MERHLAELEAERAEIYRQMGELGDFLPGGISVNYRKCGKTNCACSQEGHPGHGPQYLWTASKKGKTIARNLTLGAELDKVQRETETYKRFTNLCEKVIETNEEICKLRPIPKMEEERTWDAFKKKLKKRFWRSVKKR